MILSFKKQFESKILEGSKIHTIREDKPNRWKEGNKIHFATGVQKVEMYFFEVMDNSVLNMSIDGSRLIFGEINRFAKNDGFENFQDFSKWFSPLIEAAPNRIYTAKLIHWTNKRY